ncbi:MAG: hypothetical protein ACI4EF_06310, partial [Coprococcus sp.]
LFTASIDFGKLSDCSSIIILVICGLFCGYPIGALTAGKLYDKNAISYKTACALLPLCNNVSPMFLCGYVHKKYTCNFIPLSVSILCIYMPQLLYAAVLILYAKLHKIKEAFPEGASYNRLHSAHSESAACDSPDNNILDSSIHTITIIGIYIVIFSIIENILSSKYCNIVYLDIFTCFFEITKGCEKLFCMNIEPNIKTALILSLVSFGGISAIFQSIHLIKKSKLSLINYTTGKLLCSIVTFFLFIIYSTRIY